MIFPHIIELYPENEVARTELSLANLQFVSRVPAFSIFYLYISQETVILLILVFSGIELPIYI